MPVACMCAYIIVGPTKLNPLFFKSLLRASASLVIAGISFQVLNLFLIGFPGETEDSLNNTLNFIKKTKNILLSNWVSYYQPVPNTVGYNLAKKNGKFLSEGKSNIEITYIDNNLSKEILIKYKNLIYDVFKSK